MASAQQHYQAVLAEHYTWMFGASFDETVRGQVDRLRDLGLAQPVICVDLGCGSGFQSVALAQMGAGRVHALDTSETLLAELRGHAQGLPITPHLADLLTFPSVLSGAADTIVCMGDTLTHLTTRADVGHVFALARAHLADAGHLILSWRDLSQLPQGLDRFIPLRMTDDTLMTCFLEDQGETVLVHDLVHRRLADGWHLHKGAYPKLKLPVDWVRARVREAGFRSRRNGRFGA